jgi:hypothetical protein
MKINKLKEKEHIYNLLANSISMINFHLMIQVTIVKIYPVKKFIEGFL